MSEDTELEKRRLRFAAWHLVAVGTVESARVQGYSKGEKRHFYNECYEITAILLLVLLALLEMQINSSNMALNSFIDMVMELQIKFEEYSLWRWQALLVRTLPPSSLNHHSKQSLCPQRNIHASIKLATIH